MRTVIIASATALTLGVAHAGPLTPPPGGPTPTNKTLKQIEPRTPITSTGVQQFIGVPGSYYLAEDFVTSGSGLFILTGGVTLDLNGFAIIGNPAAPGADALIINAAASGDPTVTILNGAIRGFDDKGVQSSATTRLSLRSVNTIDCGVGFDIDGPATIADCAAINNTDNGFELDQESTLERCAADGNAARGFFALGAVVMRDCVAHDNATQGFNIETGSLINCLATRNTRGFSLGFEILGQGAVTASGCVAQANALQGFQAGDPTTLTDCSSINNGFSGFFMSANTILDGCVARDNDSSGISVGSNSAITRCVSTGNTAAGIVTGSDSSIDSCAANENAGDGIIANPGARVHNSVANNNVRDGFLIRSNSAASSCTATDNGEHGFGLSPNARVTNCNANANTLAGFQGAADATIDSCVATDNATGFIGSGSLIIRSAATDNALNYDMGTATHGAIIAPSGAFAETNAFANIEY